MLANEQVVDGRCERCGFEVTKRELTQWYFKITDYAQRLLDDMAPLENTWPERVLTAQKNWIGRSEGAHVDFVVEGRDELARILEGVKDLPDDRREALIMRFALGMDNREIARAMGRTDGATKVLLHRAIKQLEEIVATKTG